MINDIWKEMNNIQKEMDRVFHAFWKQTPHIALPQTKGLEHYNPATTDIKETEKEVIAQFDIPGVSKEDIELDVDEHTIRVKAQRKVEKKVEERGYVRNERSYQGFFRQLPLPKEVLPGEAQAEYKNGVLTVTLPKAQIKESTKKRLEIK